MTTFAAHSVMKEGKNHVYYLFPLLLLVVAALLGLHQVPRWWTREHHLRQVDLLADLRPRQEPRAVVPSDTLEQDTVAAKPEAHVVLPDSFPEGMTAIEDYSDSALRGMPRFYDALRQTERDGSRVRVAYFGDSFIEGDILTGNLRELLQGKYGGGGVGFVPVSSEVSQFRQTVLLTSSGFLRHVRHGEASFRPSLQGIMGDYFTTQGSAFAQLKGSKRPLAYLDTCELSTIFYLAQEDTMELTCTINGGQPVELRHETTASGVCAATAEGRIGQVRWSVEGGRETPFFGVAMDNRRGVSLDNFSVRGSDGLQTGRIPLETLSSFQELRPYDLIVLEYGLNVASAGRRDYSGYRQGLVRAIDKLKEAFPQASVLVVSVGDREERDEDNGELHTIDGVLYLLEAQRAAARECHVAFWNLYEAMLREGGIVGMVERRQANRDYTHINYQGGKRLARLLFDTLEEGKEQYERLNEKD
ncbi:MAG: hypothetical protein LUC33_07185 [Prevotellaceae bacterium]|nr:hypothetical protein [Prevotellaceae bacterium]